MAKGFSTQVRCYSLGALFFFVFTGVGLGQVSSAATAIANATATAPLLALFQQNQQTLVQGTLQLVAQGATPAQLTYWLNQNQDLLQAQQGLALQLGAISAAQSLPVVTSVQIPEGASQDLEDFITTQANLTNLRAQIHNQLLEQGIVSGEQESSLFQQQAGATLQQQAQRAQSIAAEADQQSLPVPPPLSIPADATTSMQAFLTLRDQLMRGQIEVHNQNLQVDMATRAAAVQAWRETHAVQFQQLQQLGQTLANETASL